MEARTSWQIRELGDGSGPLLCDLGPDETDAIYKRRQFGRTGGGDIHRHTLPTSTNATGAHQHLDLMHQTVPAETLIR